MKKQINKRVLLFTCLFILLIAIYSMYVHFTKYSPTEWLKYFEDTSDLSMISHFSFWWYIKTYETFAGFMYIAPILLIVAGCYSFFQTYRSGFLQNIIQRIGYKKAVSTEIFKCWLSSLILPIVSIVIFVISYFLYPNSKILPYEATSGYPFQLVPDSMVNMNPYLFIIVYTFILFLFSIIIINIGIIMTRYLKKFYLVIVGAFMGLIFIENINNFLVAPIVANVTNITKMLNGFSIYNLYYLDSIPSLLWEVIFSIVMTIITTLVVYFIYKKEEKVNLSYE